MHLSRPRTYTFASLGFGLAVTAAVWLIPDLRFAYQAPDLHLVLETGEGLIALLAAWLMIGRFERDRRLSQILLVTALTMLGLANLVLSVGPPLFGFDSSGRFSTWAPLIVRSFATVMVTAAAFVRDRKVPRRWQDPRISLGLALAFIIIVVIYVATFGEVFGDPKPVGDPGLSSRPMIPGLDAVLSIQVLLAGLWFAAGIGFMRRAEATGDEFAAWLAAAASLSATARVSYLLFPSLYTGYVYVGDGLRLAFHILLLVGAMREIRSYWNRVATLATEEERRRVARDLHDGIAQELLFIAAQVRAARRSEPPDVDHRLQQVQNSADRAVEEARRAIHALTVPGDEDLISALRHMVSYMDSRVEADLHLRCRSPIDVPSDQREDVIRIVREAVINAHKHSNATRIEIEVEQDPNRLIIRDDGKGFDPSTANGHGGFGLLSMRERAEAIGAQLEVRSAEGKGTTVEVLL
ncbi:MAG: histidine kinase [Actinomycetota bacterium]